MGCCRALWRPYGRLCWLAIGSLSALSGLHGGLKGAPFKHDRVFVAWFLALWSFLWSGS